MFDPSTRVLVVDDMMTMRKLVRKICKDIGFEVVDEAPDGAKAWEALQKADPAYGLVISDWNMPNCTGIELLKKVRNDVRFSHLPFILVTAEAEKHQILEALQAGVSNYVVKPFSAEILKEKLEEAHRRTLSAAWCSRSHGK